ncbi:LCI fold-containing protein [Photorhabdus aegyptia]|uniref:Antimicrobial protein n=1 Tax=Photorhabdus aegyptia TaxID=2805098 RepID=A0A022PFB2_9GAMM|nr:LCI fold-containing protein [Photorhabdus aegyptia]EYU14406.1 antimicrobial protein [Photorhabdus aegyptia]
MFKKLLTVGALATALIGGIGTASANVPINGECASTAADGSNYFNRDGELIYYHHLVSPDNIFANVYDRNGIRWYFKSSKYESFCGKYVAYYEGRKI